jgi:hypothetical protein
MRSEMSASEVLLRLEYLEVDVAFPDLNIGTEKKGCPRDIPTIMKSEYSVFAAYFLWSSS